MTRAEATGLAAAAITAWLVFRSLYAGAFSDAGAVGHDFSYVLPALLAGRQWLEVNGPLAVPWFSPAFCAGFPFLADPQSMVYSLPQLLTVVGDPLWAAWVTIQLAAAAGLAGMYVLCRGPLGMPRGPAAVAAVVFMFNGFFAAHVLAGHLAFHGFMLVPLAAVAVLAGQRWNGRGVVVAGLIVAGWVLSGMAVLLLVAVAATVALVLVAALMHRPPVGRAPPGKASPAAAAPWIRGALAVALGTGLSAPKLVASFTLLAALPRTDYRVPGFPSLGEELWYLGRALFLAPASIASEVVLVNRQWAVGRHELELGVTAVPAVAIAVGLVVWLSRLRRVHMPAVVPLPAVALAVLVVVPLALNLHAQPWQAMLKAVPVVGSSSLHLRWFALYIPLLAVAAAVGLAQVRRPAVQGVLCVAGVVAVIASTAAADRPAAAGRTYDARLLLEAASRPLPPITAVGDTPGERPNDQLVHGLSSPRCYQPMLGYRREHFRAGPLHDGPALDASGDLLNFKDPRCYLGGGCAPGDHFPTSRRAELERFLQYRPLPWDGGLPMRLGWLAFAMAVGAVMVPWVVRARRRKPSP